MKLFKFLSWGLPLLVLLVLTFSSPKSSFAQSGCCSWHGGESYCDYSTDRWVCNDGTYSPTCTCGSYQAPAYVPPPTCPLNSYYDGSTCKCYAGYVSNGSYCISNLQNCWNTYGYNSTYDYASGSCACESGYVMRNGTCESGNQYCWNTYGMDSEYNSLSKTCECDTGYVWDSSGSSCISGNESCHNQFGLMSYYNSLNNTCVCLAGYTIIGGKCTPIPVYIPEAQSVTPTPEPVYQPPVQATPTPEPTISADPNLITSDLKLGDSGSQVSTLQAILAKDKSVYPEGKITGYFGNSTKQAVEAFQKKYGLSVTGIVNAATRLKLTAVFGKIEITPVPSVPPEPQPAFSFLFSALRGILTWLFH